MRLGAKIIFQRLATEDLMRVKRPFLRPSTKTPSGRPFVFASLRSKRGAGGIEIPSDGL